MNLKDDVELANTRSKLALLEARYEELLKRPSEDDELRASTIRSVKKYIHQFKEEIARYECSRNGQTDTASPCDSNRNIVSEAQLENTRNKLRHLEELVEANTQKVGDEELRRAERISLKRLINQFKEEIVRYEAHQHIH